MGYLEKQVRMGKNELYSYSLPNVYPRYVFRWSTFIINADRNIFGLAHLTLQATSARMRITTQPYHLNAIHALSYPILLSMTNVNILYVTGAESICLQCFLTAKFRKETVGTDE